MPHFVPDASIFGPLPAARLRRLNPGFSPACGLHLVQHPAPAINTGACSRSNIQRSLCIPKTGDATSRTLPGTTNIITELTTVLHERLLAYERSSKLDFTDSATAQTRLPEP